MTTTTIRFIFQGVPIDLSVEDLGRLAEIKAGLVEAKKLGFEGQPLMRGPAAGGFGPGKGRPAPVAPVRNAAGRLCCPTHAGERRSELQKKDWAAGAVYACGCKDAEGAWCKYKIEAADYDRFEREVPQAAPANSAPGRDVAPAPTTPPRDVPEARQRFYMRYGTRIGGTTWRNVQDFLQDARPEPRSIEAWIAVAEEIRERLRGQAA